jgi:nicotinamide riboside kinase
MKRIITFTVVSVLCFIIVSHTNKKHDEGMFLLSDLKNIDLKKIGMDITPEQLYNPKGTSLIDAIVRVGGCTGSFVSENGLIVTNHHCAFSFVQAISDTQNNFIKNGFLARNPKEEVLAKGLVCRITASYEDVSHKILQETYRINDPQLRSQIITKNIKAITDYENKNNPGLQCEISEMFTGRTYVLFRYKLLKDVRLVYVPARSVGEYGGELDNWVWPRHSGDFAFLRAYVAPDGSSAEYNVANVPYKPAKHLKVNPKGVRENDFVFVLGYPGRTYRHQPAKFFQYHEQYLLKYVSDLYDWQINTMQELSVGNEALAIKYAGKEKSLANVTKNYKGKMQGFSRSGLTKQKFEDEQQLQQFIDADDYLKQKYANVIPRINQLYDTIIQFAQRNLWYDYIYNVSPTLLCAAIMDNYADEYRKLTSDAERKIFMEKQTPRLKAAIARYVGLYDRPFEQRALVKMIKRIQILKSTLQPYLQKPFLTTQLKQTKYLSKIPLNLCLRRIRLLR